MKGFIFDLDGTVYLGDRLIEGADQVIKTLRDRGDKVVFLSNKPIATRQSYADKLTKMGIPTKVDDILNSSLITARYLKKILKKNDLVYVIGEEPIHIELKEHCIPVTSNYLESTHVVISWDRKFTYEKLNEAFQACMRGAQVIASNPDRTCPLEDGQIPDTGAIIGALEGASGKPVDLIIGKPSTIIAEAAIKHLGLGYKDCYMVGDRLETDIKMGNDTGMNSVLVLTGITTKDMLNQTDYQPKYVLNSIKEVINL